MGTITGWDVTFATFTTFRVAGGKDITTFLAAWMDYNVFFWEHMKGAFRKGWFRLALDARNVSQSTH